ncbi:adenosine kinase isoform X1 [Tachysurus ichikawai]
MFLFPAVQWTAHNMSYRPPCRSLPDHPPASRAHSEVLLDKLFLPDSVAGGVTEVLRVRGDLFTELKQLCANRRFEEIVKNFKVEYHAGGATQNSVMIAQCCSSTKKKKSVDG